MAREGNGWPRHGLHVLRVATPIVFRFLRTAQAIIFALMLLPVPAVLAQEGNPRHPDATPRVMQIPRLNRPTLPAQPSPADLGGQVYFDYCMTCHGDRGQGLTDEWRGVFDAQDQNCWQFRCHASTHPVEGFELPQTVPAVVGPGVRAAFSNALALHDFIAHKMPYQTPGQLPAAAYWQVTAYLVRANGIDPGIQPLDAARAAALPLNPAGPGIWPWFAGLGVAIVVAAGALLLRRRGRAGRA
ncbi:MAG TPA: hypothetical protein VGA61_15130 [Anaerolineae bacterium]